MPTFPNCHGKPMRASLVSRLAEAADGIRTGNDIWFIARPDPHPDTRHEVKGHFNTEQDAITAKTAHGSNFEVYGPFHTPKDPDYDRTETIEKVVLHMKPLGGGATRELCLSGQDYDAVFWSMAAVDKFVVPYYVSMADLDEAARLRKDFGTVTTVALIHLPGSAYTNSAGECIDPRTQNNFGIQMVALRPVGPQPDPGVDFSPV